jgi:hypothetical protein
MIKYFLNNGSIYELRFNNSRIKTLENKSVSFGKPIIKVKYPKGAEAPQFFEVTKAMYKAAYDTLEDAQAAL